MTVIVIAVVAAVSVCSCVAVLRWRGRANKHE